MDRSDFDGSPAGQTVQTTHGQWAFVPRALPPQIDCSRLINLYGETMQAVGSLDGISRRLRNPYMIIRPLQRQEALTSSSMEGTHASPDDLALIESGENEQIDESAREVWNYIRALEESVEALKSLPISHRMIKNMHRTLLSGLSKWRGSNKMPGEYKVHQNFIGGSAIEKARFIPPPPNQAEKCMDDLEAYINAEDGQIPPLINIALIHYQFETIHPFADGNGRVGRIMIPIYLIYKRVLKSPILYVSPFIEKNKDAYIDLMFNVSRNGAWIDWIEFFLQAIKETCVQANKTIDRLLDLETEYRQKAHGISRSGVAAQLVDYLFEHPVLTIPSAARMANVTYPPAQNAIQKLIEVGILSEIKGFEHPKRFMARDVVLVSAGLDRITGVTSEPL